MQQCTQGKRHTWQFVCNVQITRMSTRTASISTRGKYRCACGETKLGQAVFQ